MGGYFDSAQPPETSSEMSATDIRSLSGPPTLWCIATANHKWTGQKRVQWSMG